MLLTMGRYFLTIMFVAAAFACGAAVTWAADTEQQTHPDVLAAEVRASGADTFDFDVTISSPYETPQRYAVAFHVTGKDGAI